MNQYIKQAGNIAEDLNTGNPINWNELDKIFNKYGKEKTLTILNNEYKGANNIYKSHLDLAVTAINKN